MMDFFGEEYMGEPFRMFSTPHLIAILIIFLVSATIYILKDRLRNKRINSYFRYAMGCILVIEQSLLYLWYHMNHLWSFSLSLPLNLCEAAVILTIILVFTKSYCIYEIVYFWAMSGVLGAIITPDINGYNTSHFIFYHFFITHGFIVVAVLFMTFVNQYKPKFMSIIKVMGITNVYAFFVGVINILTGGNYLFICSKPKAASIIDCLGPWPWYILSLEGIAFVLFFIFYLPFFITNIRSKHEAELKL